jgi:hypothetical protein
MVSLAYTQVENRKGVMYNMKSYHSMPDTFIMISKPRSHHVPNRLGDTFDREDQLDFRGRPVKTNEQLA